MKVVYWLHRVYHKMALMATLRLLVKYNEDYDKRHKLVLYALYLASDLGYKVAFDYDFKGNVGLMQVVYIDFGGTTGQVSWHMREGTIRYDGHSTAMKLARLSRLSKSLPPPPR